MTGSAASATKHTRGMRDRILDAASALFYEQGIRATSADRIIAEVGTTKVTFYRHFRSKSDLVVAYLEQQARRERSWIDGLPAVANPRERLREIAQGLGAVSCTPGFRGCVFINAAAEFSDPDDPVRRVVLERRDWMLGVFAAIAKEAGAARADFVADQLMMLRDGAMVSGYLEESTGVAELLGEGFDAVLSAAV